MDDLSRIASVEGRLVVERAPEGFDVLVCAQAVTKRGGRGLYLARDSRRADAVATAARFFAPELKVLRLPTWDCQPYDRVSPSAGVAAQRAAALAWLARGKDVGPLLVVAPITAATQRCAPRAALKRAGFRARVGEVVELEKLTEHLQRNGYARVPQVTEAGEYALRGGVVDVFPPGRSQPLRLDFFGDQLESVRAFAVETQRSTKQMDAATLEPVSEALLDAASVTRFRQGFVKRFGGVGHTDPVYAAVSEGGRAQGMEHWLSLFHERLETVFDYVGDGALVFLDHLAEQAAHERRALIEDYYAARKEDATLAGEGGFSAPAYRALPPDDLYLSDDELTERLADRDVRVFDAFSSPDEVGPVERIDLGARPGRTFKAERATEGANVFDAAAEHIKALRNAGKRVVVASWTDGARSRTGGVLEDHGIASQADAKTWPEAMALKGKTVARVVLPLEAGFETDDVAVVSEQDILGERLARPRKKRKSANFIAEAASLSTGDLVVHREHGIGRYLGLKTLEVQGAKKDCLDILYGGEAKLFLPVENIELLSRYGADDGDAVLDKLGGAAWQNRKAKAKKRLREMAAELIKIAAQREVKTAEPLAAPPGLYAEFTARFPYAETDDQLNAIDDVLGDLSGGKPMDRLVCGDVGFGKTEVALRAAFAAAINGRQVAVVAPTTLLVRQHYKTLTERFRGWPIKVRQLSRLVTTKDANETRAALAEGRIDIVVGTHALLAKSVSFKDLGLLIVDEEQHFGVRHKERLKELRADVHVLTLTATPIPRTLQMALSGIRDLSIIATPPVDRLAVRTAVAPFDPVQVREALLRERYRGGHSFFVCPRLQHLPKAEEFLTERCPELSYVVAHGQMSPTELEDRIGAFYEGRYDVLLSTPIVESGLDIPTANTLVVYRSDMFGLAQLYQLRGRVGRSKTRAYAFLTVPATFKITDGAEKRLKVLQSLDTLGAGFQLASHDLDLRGGGNLLGEEQSGHIKDVGVELFQSMLEDAVAQAKDEPETDGDWSPAINVGASVLIPEDYIPDLDLRLGLYRRLSNLDTQTERESFAAELIDRFGPLPDEVGHLMEVVEIKGLCREAKVAKVDAGPKGAVAHFRPDAFDDPSRLIALVARRQAQFKLRPDETLFCAGDWPTPKSRIKGVKTMLRTLVEAREGEMVGA